MSLMLHIIRADVRRFRIAILLWTLVTAASALLQGIAPLVAVQRQQAAAIGLAAAVLWLARMVFAATLTALIVHTHAVVGSTAFWMTRPFPPRTLLLAKVSLVGMLLVGVPAICDVVLMASYHVPPADILRVVLEWTLIRAIGMGLLMAAAALTRSFPRFALLLGGALVAAAVLVNAALFVYMARQERAAVITVGISDTAYAFNSHGPDQTGAVLSWLVLLAGILLLLRSLYYTRSRPRSLAVGGAFSAAAFVLAFVWPWPLLRAAPHPPAWAEAAGTITLHGPSQPIYFDNAGIPNFEGPRWRTATARVFLSGVPDGWLAMVRLLRGSLVYPGGQVVSAEFPGMTMPPRSRDVPNIQRHVFQQALGVTVIGGLGGGVFSTTPILRAPHMEVPPDRLVASYSGEFEVALSRVDVAATLPLQPGATFQDGAYRLVIHGIALREGGPMLTVRASNALSVFHRAPQPSYRFFLRNRVLGEAVAGDPLILSGAAQVPLLNLGGYVHLSSPFGFFAEAEQIRFPSTYGAQLPSALVAGKGYTWTDDVWLKSADFVIIRMTPEGSVRRPLRLDDLEVNGSSRR
jgi:hypothetical protein